MELHVFPIPIPPPTSLSTQFLWVFPVYQPYMQNRKRDTGVQNRLLDSVGEGKGGMFRKNSIETCIIYRETDHQPRLDAWDRCSGLVYWEDPESESLSKFESENESVSHSVVWLFVIPWTVAHQTPLAIEFFGQECWSWLPFHSLESLPDSGIEPGSPALQVDSLPSEPLVLNPQLGPDIIKLQRDYMPFCVYVVWDNEEISEMLVC